MSQILYQTFELFVKRSWNIPEFAQWSPIDNNQMKLFSRSSVLKTAAMNEKNAGCYLRVPDVTKIFFISVAAMTSFASAKRI